MWSLEELIHHGVAQPQTLANSLPPLNLANAEKELTNNFKAAARSLATLYCSSRRTSKRAYNAGYSAACNDLLLMIQQGVSAGESSDPDGRGMTIARIMDYLEARLEAIKAREEEEDEDEERTKPASSTNVITPTVPEPVAKAPSPPNPMPFKEHVCPLIFSSDLVADSLIACDGAINTIYTAIIRRHPHILYSPPSSPSSPPSAPLRSASVQPAPSHGFTRPVKTRPFAPSIVKELSPASFAFATPTSSELALSPLDLGRTLTDSPIGTKRRRDAMLLDTAPAPFASDAVAGSSRRRTRSARAVSQDQNHAEADAMEVEEDGRERKRVARR
ncbi:hypothetical protein A0H81_14871 [Grifola frondosa]|uniref:Uncharacterized protein n=1 Tax=Grifola frondosa TaxID=5627 RepID=A0A1C7LK53_GRIFR|nr:hypothetical protein A0H81_14871 [Grifola frondosa]